MLDDKSLLAWFGDPPASYRPQPFWFINHEADPQELVRQVHMMHEKGVGGFAFHARHGLRVRYNSPEWLNALRAVTEEAHRLGMVVWLYDEENWPSGTDGGRLTLEHPEFRMRYLRYWEQRVTGPQHVDIQPTIDDNILLKVFLTPLTNDAESAQPDLDRSEDVTAQYDAAGNTLSLEIPAGAYVASFFFICPVPQGVTFLNGWYLDTLDSDACDEFVRRCYEPNLAAVAEYMGNTVQGIFTDEPGLMIHDGFFGSRAFRPDIADPLRRLPGSVMAWSRRFPEMFLQWRGYDLLPHLLTLVYETRPEDVRIRQDYYRTATEAYINHYYGAIKRFTRRNNLKLIGHTLEEPIWAQARSQGNQHQVLFQFDWPGYDYLAMQNGIATAQNPARLLAAQCAASIAALKGGERIMVEAFGGSGNSATLAERRRHANMMALFGTSLFMPHGFYQSFAGERKSDWPPSEFYQAAFWEQYHSFADYLGRLSLVAHAGKPVEPVMILSPIATAYRQLAGNGQVNDKLDVDRVYSALSYGLLARQRNHIYIDERHLHLGVLSPHGLSFNDYVNNLDVLIVPAASILDDKTVTFLLDFNAYGGKILWLERMPDRTVTGAPFPGDKFTGDNNRLLQFDLDQIEAVLDAWRPQSLKVAAEPSEGALVVTKKAGSVYLVLAFNPLEGSPSECTLAVGAPDYSVEELLLETGEQVCRAENAQCYRFTLQPSELRVFRLTSGGAPAKVRAEAQAPSSLRSVKAQSLQLAHDNLLPLDHWSIDLSIRPEERPEGLLRFMQHTTVIRYSTRFTARDLPSKLWLVLDDFAQYLPAHYGVLTGYRSFELTVNGRQVPPFQSLEYPDHYSTGQDILPYTQVGANEIAIYVGQSNERPAAPTLQYPPLLAGDFALNQQDELIAPNPRQIGYWDQAGAPYYSGIASYRFDLTLSEPAQRIWLDFGEGHESLQIFVNGKLAASRAWAPYALCVPAEWRQGVNKVEVQVANTAANLYEKRRSRSGINGILRYAFTE
ncbi:MAG: hypothetical protein LLG44_07725 [Chloroflexi bacterium]|nr:hypothetical protein [Chloroflexota bacterium]